jgi:hypothetical protein
VSASTTAGRPSARFFAWAVALLFVAGVVQAVGVRLIDPLPGAWWIGFYEKARLGMSTELAFVARFQLESPAPGARLKLRAVGAGTIFLDGRAIAKGTGASDLAVPLAAGDHELAVVLRHPEGIASLKLRLETPEKVVVTGPLWRVDDDLKRMEKEGFGGARYPATMWARPFVSSLDSSSSTRSWRGSADVSRAPSSSRIPSRAATE